MSVTQKQIAEKLNISQSMVARALKGYKEISSETRGRIEATAREMGYNLEGNREARALIARRFGNRVRTGVVAVLISPAPGSSVRTMPYFIPVIEGIEQESVKYNLDVCLCTTRADELPRLVRDRSVDGVITMGYYPSYIQAIREFDLPVVTFHTRYHNAHSVVADDKGGAYQATRHLLEKGHRRIAFLGIKFETGQPCERRIAGYRQAMREYGMEVTDDWISHEYPMPFSHCSGCDNCAGCQGWKRLQERNAAPNGKLPFSAMVCYNDMIAMSAITQLQQGGYSVPEDISITGFDDISKEHNFRPTVTSVRYSRGEMGRDAMQLLYEVIGGTDDSREDDGEVDDACIHRIFPAELAVHKSTAKV